MKGQRPGGSKGEIVATAQQILQIAAKQIGVKEKPPGSDKVRYGDWYPMPGAPWCAMFVSWVLDKGGITGFKHAYTPTGAELFRKAGRWFTSGPRPGDIVYFDFPDSLHRIQHVGFVEKTNGDGSITTIEGNTSSGNSGSQDRGGGVYRRVRTSSVIVGYGRPPYKGEGKLPKPADKFPQRAWFGVGDKGADVRRWQRQLGTVMDADIEVDGEFGPETLKLTKAFQKAGGLEVDGKVGPETLAKIEKLFVKAKTAQGGRPPTLELYDTGPWVKKAQKLLLERGHNLGRWGADGDFGPDTAAAVVAFKKKSGLPPQPVIGPRAWKKLLEGPPKGDGPKSSSVTSTSAPKPKPAKPRGLSTRGAKFIGRFEGFRGALYNDAAGHCTIGYGHLVHHGRCNGKEPAEFRAGISEKRAAELLQQDAAVAAAEVVKNVNVALNQAQFDALVSFVFNLGGGAFRGSTLLKRLNAGEYGAVPSELDRWVHAGGRRLEGLVRRRAAEGRLFREGKYT